MQLNRHKGALICEELMVMPIVRAHFTQSKLCKRALHVRQPESLDVFMSFDHHVDWYTGVTTF